MFYVLHPRGKHEHSTLVLTFASEMRVVGGR